MFNWIKWKFKFFSRTIVMKVNINIWANEYVDDDGGRSSGDAAFEKRNHKIVNTKFRDFVEVFTTMNNTTQHNNTNFNSIIIFFSSTKWNSKKKRITLLLEIFLGIKKQSNSVVSGYVRESGGDTFYSCLYALVKLQTNQKKKKKHKRNISHHKFVLTRLNCCCNFFLPLPPHLVNYVFSLSFHLPLNSIIIYCRLEKIAYHKNFMNVVSPL